MFVRSSSNFDCAARCDTTSDLQRLGHIGMSPQLKGEPHWLAVAVGVGVFFLLDFCVFDPVHDWIFLSHTALQDNVLECRLNGICEFEDGVRTYVSKPWAWSGHLTAILFFLVQIAAGIRASRATNDVFALIASGTPASESREALHPMEERQSANTDLSLNEPKELHTVAKVTFGDFKFKAVTAAVNAAPAAELEDLIQEYLLLHPDYRYPLSGDRHPAILCLGSMKSWLIARKGGPVSFFRTVLEAAKFWFPPGCGSREFKIFCVLFEGEGNIAWEGRPELEALAMEYNRWRVGVVRARQKSSA